MLRQGDIHSSKAGFAQLYLKMATQILHIRSVLRQPLEADDRLRETASSLMRISYELQTSFSPLSPNLLITLFKIRTIAHGLFMLRSQVLIAQR